MTIRTSVGSIALIFVFILSTGISTFAGPAEFPDTPAGKRAREILGLLNQGDEDAARQYIESGYTPGFRDAFPMSQHLGMFQMTGKMFPQLALGQVVESLDTGIRVALRSASTKAWLHLDLQVEPQAPHRILSMGLFPGDPPEDAPGDSGPAATAEEKKVPFSSIEGLDAYLVRRTADNEFSGVVLAARNGDPMFHKAYGLANRTFGVPNQPDTRFNIGSLNKLFTSVAIAQLAEKGKLGLDDLLGTHLKGFAPEAAEKVTIRHLLQMRSGWGDYWGNETYLATRNDLRTVGDYITFLKDVPLSFEPGTDNTHSNTSFEILGAVIEKVSGLDYFEYIRRHIYQPAGMTRSDSYHRDGPAQDLATGYTDMNPADPEGTGYRWANTFMLSPRGTPAGGGYSTTGDLLRFRQALCGHKLLGENYTNLVLRQFNGEPGDPFHPKGPMVLAGGAPGINSLFAVDLAVGWTVVVLSNYDMPVAIVLGQDILNMLKDDVPPAASEGGQRTGCCRR